MNNKKFSRRFTSLERAKIEQRGWGFVGDKMRATIRKSGTDYVVVIDTAGTTSAPRTVK